MSGRQGPGDDADKPQEASKDQEHKSTTKTLDSSSCGGAGPSQYDRNDGGEENSAALSCSLATSPEPAGGHDQKRQSSQLVIDLSRMDNQRQSHQDQEIPLKSMGEKVDQDDPNNNNDLTDQPNASKGTSIYGFNNTNQDHSTDRRKMHMEIFSVNSGNTTCEDSSWDVSCANSTTIGQAGLLLYSREPLRLKDFKTEVRGQMDVEQFSHQAELLLDLNEVSMDGIIDAMLAKVAQNDRIKTDKLAEIREAIFIPGSSVLMARTIQGFYSVAECLDWDHHHQEVSPDGTVAATIRHDQSWLCALCNLAKVSKRHMVVARFKQPINMGENAREVRLFVLIIVPTKEKSTKDQVETGRTFATMLTDAHFRQLLLHASSQTEFKALMIAKAQQLARSQRLKNRHKYLLDPILHESVSSSSLNDQQQQQSKQMKCVGKSPMQDDSSSFVTSLAINADGQKLATGDSAGESSAKFQRNPRTSKLFELISETSTTTSNSNNKSPTGMDKKVPQVEFLNSDKFRRLEEAKDKPHRGRCAFLGQLEFGKGAWQDFTRRLRYYPSDFIDAFVGPPRTTQKTVATIWFLYFGILLPTIAFSSLNTVQTHGHMGDLRKAIIGQAIGGLVFALFGGQPLVIIMTTAPLCLYTKVIHQMCLDYGFPFPAMYAAVGLWNGLFLTIYSLFGFSKLMRWCTRSTEEIFALFIVVAFVTDAGKDMMKNFRRFYFTPACEAQNNQTTNVMIDGNQTMLMTNVMRSPGDTSMGVSSPRNSSSHAYRDIEEEIESSVCRRETSLLFVLLMLGTLWLAVTLYKFKRTPYLSAGKRDILADYALPTAVILMSLVGATIFDDIYVEKFPPLVDIHFERARVDLLPWSGLLTSMGLGFTLSLLFFMDQNISAAMVMAPQNKLKKGSAYHYDLLIVGVLNGVLSLYGLPMMHGVLPHSPLHVRSLADIEQQVEEGHLREVVVNCRETRVTGIVAHVLVLLSLLLIPYPIAYIPRAVLNGLFLYMAVTSLDGLQVFERILLLVTEQSKYPPNHYIRRCPQRKIHQFTMLQLVQLIVMCLFGFSPINIVEMFFPVFILLMIPFRHKIVPKYIEDKYLEALDGKH